MTLSEQIDSDLKDAMRAQDSRRLLTLRLLKAAVKNAAIAQRLDALPDADVLTIIQRQIKQRREAIEAYQRGGRTDLASQEEAELVILARYGPPQLGDAELHQLIEQAVIASGAASPADQGKVMKSLMPLLQGRADGKRVSQLVSDRLKPS